MIYCYDEKGEEMSVDEALYVIGAAAHRLFPLFPREGFSKDDLVQQATLSLLRQFPFENPRLLYVAAYRDIIDYHRYIEGRNRTVDRGGRQMTSIDEFPYDFLHDREDPPGHAAEVREEVDWAMSQLTQTERAIILAYASISTRGGGEIREVANRLGVTSPRVSQMFREIQEKMRKRRPL